MNDFDDIALTRVALGIRFSKQFSIEDSLGEIADDVLASENFGPDRFQETRFSPGMRQLLSEGGTETLSFTCADAIYEGRLKDVTLASLSSTAQQFTDVVWAAVCEHAKRPPAIDRYGCLVGFALPPEWSPLRGVLGVEVAESSEFDLRYSRRLPAEEALAMADVTDYRNVMFYVQTRKGQHSAVIDFQHYFVPPLGNARTRRDHPFPRFADKAAAYVRTAGWDFLKSRLERLQRAA